LLFSIGQLGDFAVSNQVFFFNEEDLKQINLIQGESESETDIGTKEGAGSDEGSPKSIAEGRKLFEDVRDIAEKIFAVLPPQ
jgi:hypothetical protein